MNISPAVKMSPIKILHVRRNKRSGSDYTFAYQIDYNTNSVEYAYSKCHKNDQFERKIGSSMVKERFLRCNNNVITNLHSDRYAVIEEALRKLANMNILP